MPYPGTPKGSLGGRSLVGSCIYDEPKYVNKIDNWEKMFLISHKKDDQLTFVPVTTFIPDSLSCSVIVFDIRLSNVRNTYKEHHRYNKIVLLKR